MNCGPMREDTEVHDLEVLDSDSASPSDPCDLGSVSRSLSRNRATVNEAVPLGVLFLPLFSQGALVT